jgi:signal transduction histidine kinase
VIPGRWRWTFVIVPALVVGAIELLSDTILDPYLPFPWDTVVVTLVVALIAGALAAWAFRRIDELTTSLELRNNEVESRAATASALHAVTLAIASLSDLDAILQTTVDSARTLLHADASLLTLTGPDGDVRLRASSGRSQAFDITGEQDGDDVRRFLRGDETAAILAAPLRRGGTTIGSLAVVGRRDPGPAVDELETLSSLANQAALAIENDRLATELRAAAIRRERERIAGEIHDGLAQVLGYVNTKSQAVEGLLEAGRLDEARVQMAELAAAARSVYVDVREAIAGLAEPQDVGVDLESQIRDYVDRYAESAKIAARVERVGGTELPPLPTTVRAEVFAIVREALTNVRKHAAARRVVVSLERRDPGIAIAIVDDGRGFDPAHVDGSAADWPHFGMTAMRRRAAAIGAHVDWTSTPGAGCRVDVVAPLAPTVAPAMGQAGGASR